MNIRPTTITHDFPAHFGINWQSTFRQTPQRRLRISFLARIAVPIVDKILHIKITANMIIILLTMYIYLSFTAICLHLHF